MTKIVLTTIEGQVKGLHTFRQGGPPKREWKFVLLQFEMHAVGKDVKSMINDIIAILHKYCMCSPIFWYIAHPHIVFWLVVYIVSHVHCKLWQLINDLLVLDYWYIFHWGYKYVKGWTIIIRECIFFFCFYSIDKMERKNICGENQIKDLRTKIEFVLIQFFLFKPWNYTCSLSI